eukprot:m51a1_g7843 hypothetical protein (301) ;mRNA; r:205957-210433
MEKKGARRQHAVHQRMTQMRQVVFADTCRWLHRVLRSSGDQSSLQARAWSLCKLTRNRSAGNLNTAPGAYRRWLVQFLCEHVYVRHAAPAIDVEDPPIEDLATDPLMTSFSAHGLSCYATGAARCTNPRCAQLYCSLCGAIPFHFRATPAKESPTGSRSHHKYLNYQTRYRRVIFEDTCQWLHRALRCPESPSVRQACADRAWSLFTAVRDKPNYNREAGALRAWLVQFLCDSVYEGHEAPEIDVYDPPIEEMARDPRVTPWAYRRYLALCRSSARVVAHPDVQSVVNKVIFAFRGTIGF